MSPWRKVVYSLGSLGAALPGQVVTTYILFFYVDVLRAPAARIGQMMAIWSLWNAINDPLLGFISDRTRSRWGRRIPYIATGWLPLAIAFYLLWAPPPGVRESTAGALPWYFLITICAYDFFFTMTVLNWTALFPEMFPQLRERASVSAMRQAWTLVGLALGMALGSTVADALGWDGMGLLFGVITGLALLASLAGAREDPRFGQAQALSLLPALRHTLANFSFVTFALVSFSVQLALAVIQAAIPFYTKYALGLSPLGNTLVLASTFGVMAVTLPLWVRRTNAVGPRRAMLEGVVLFLVSLTGFWLARDLVSAMVAAGVVGLGVSAVLLLLDVLISDVIDEDHLQTGQRREGMYFGMHALILRLNGIAQAAILAFVLTRSGYSPDLAVQPESALTGLRLLVTAVPAAILAITLVWLWLYPLHGTRLSRIREGVRQLRVGASAPQSAS